jgi:hypothetical protein|tara:strand:+ start:192 stop:392 length:201 start_codon:yes stop_codon:yes gene_type:complete
LNTANVAGSILTTTGVSAQVLTRKAEVMEDMEDISLSGNANTYVLRYNKSDDTYKSDKRNLDGGSF